MNRYVAQGDGFPADNEFLMLIQAIIGEVSQLATLGGTNYIVKGCEVSGGNVSAGWMVLDGEVLPFEAGALGTQVTIIETVTNAVYLEDANNDNQGDSKPTYFTRKAVFGSNGVATYNWAAIEKSPFAELQRRLPPIGSALPWSGNVAQLPEGWALFAPMAGRFVVGYDPNDSDYNAIGKTGGAKEVTLTVTEMPAHKHTGSTGQAGSHSHNITVHRTNGFNTTQNGVGGPTDIDVPKQGQTQSSGQHSHNISLNNEGGSEAHENRPQYYTLAWIHYVGV